MEAESAEHQRAHNRSSPASFSPASTRCIMIAELRWNIFNLVGPPDTPVTRSIGQLSETGWVSFDFPRTRMTLLALALTCKLFTEPALNILWRHLGGIEPLIRCLPQSLWKQHRGRLEFQRAMTLKDWTIFCKYNHRVRSLLNQCHQQYSRDMKYGAEIWRALSCPPFSLPLLPNLTSLTWTEASDETLQYIQLFVTPKLTMLNISSVHFLVPFTFGPSEQSIFLSIAKSCPSISHFDFDFGRDTDDSTESVGDTLQLWSQLTSVKTGTLPEAAILHLSNLPSLRILKFTLPSILISADTQKLLQRPMFCALQELNISSRNMVFLDAFLKELTIAPKIVSFTIKDGVGSARALPDMISRISNACAYNSLQQVQLIITARPPDLETSIEAASFQPLLAFRNLREFCFVVGCVVRMDDAALLQMAKAWPLLEDLSITGYPHSSHQVTPHAFVLLLRHCPHLVSVAIPVDWSTIDMSAIPRDVPYQGFSHNALSRLAFEGSKIENPISIAAFISAIAPNVSSIQGDDEDYYEDDVFSEHYPSWKMVQDLIPALPIIREQGMRIMLNRSLQGSYSHRGVAQRGGRQ
ncbi:uncharacterized protein F5147DRAFT_772785 [Suillus discolor]|uniref:F-box domain-containing protein n=1 Tax=Suillus discolor TaxID=1912936 RepID=A0A9P7F7U2_9AGAM|nr:uncharacterized protein F5147DRAFT_772785 [Suillus discolor]KAG2109936.1 hypothetical protein F5147DRAFT_772785 [Suillus discolor]